MVSCEWVCNPPRSIRSSGPGREPARHRAASHVPSSLVLVWRCKCPPLRIVTERPRALSCKNCPWGGKNYFRGGSAVSCVLHRQVAKPSPTAELARRRSVVGSGTCKQSSPTAMNWLAARGRGNMPVSPDPRAVLRSRAASSPPAARGRRWARGQWTESATTGRHSRRRTGGRPRCDAG
jgi:hypothetical protein